MKALINVTGVYPVGTWLAEPIVADLSKTDPETELQGRTVVKTTDADRYGVDVAEYFI